MRVVVYGLWHLGCVTTACMAESSGHDVVALDPDADLVERIRAGRPPVEEPGLAELLENGRASGRLTFTSDAAAALDGADVLWVTFDTPVDEHDRADVDFVRERLERVRGQVRPGTLVLISSQVPVGFTRALADEWAGRDIRFGYSPENVRIGRALESFRNPDRVVVGLSHPDRDRDVVTRLLAPLGGPPVEWMTLESAEMTKHAVNAFLATSVTFINELARLCEAVGADAKEVERGLRTERRIGPKAYLAPGAAFTGGTLARDLQFLAAVGQARHVGTPLLSGVLASNALHLAWAREKVRGLLADVIGPPVVAVLGLAYMPGTDRLARSAGVELCRWLHGQGVRVRAYDPAVAGGSTPEELAGSAEVCGRAADALAGADLAVVATEWPAFRKLSGDDVAGAMRRPRVLDPNWYLAANLAADPRVTYVATGRGERK
jgi:UDPglucose 6-dehydrogenase